MDRYFLPVEFEFTTLPLIKDHPANQHKCRGLVYDFICVFTTSITQNGCAATWVLTGRSDRSVVIVFALVTHSTHNDACVVHNFKQGHVPRGPEGNHQLPHKRTGTHFAA